MNGYVGLSVIQHTPLKNLLYIDHIRLFIDHIRARSFCFNPHFRRLCNCCADQSYEKSVDVSYFQGL